MSLGKLKHLRGGRELRMQTLGMQPDTFQWKRTNSMTRWKSPKSLRAAFWVLDVPFDTQHLKRWPETLYSDSGHAAAQWCPFSSSLIFSNLLPTHRKKQRSIRAGGRTVSVFFSVGTWDIISYKITHMYCCMIWSIVGASKTPAFPAPDKEQALLVAF